MLDQKHKEFLKFRDSKTGYARKHYKACKCKPKSLNCVPLSGISGYLEQDRIHYKPEPFKWKTLPKNQKYKVLTKRISNKVVGNPEFLNLFN